MQANAPNTNRLHLGLLLLILAGGLALRLPSLDLMTFRYDSAEELFRARRTVHLGAPPLTGIENSLGFHNPAGFTWLLQVTTLFTPDPRWAAAWLGLVGLSGLYPI
ncbi:MAG: hypothetical protein K1X53_02600, partial [Candidatus Sumerlaeaceae bacterium]|nr:hypothetical protein [Candidatus Sumerlaeaceae bacterium]